MLFVLLSAVATVSVGGYFIFSIIEQNEEASASYRVMMEEAFDREIKLQTEGLVSSLNGIYEEQKAGALTEEQAKLADIDADGRLCLEKAGLITYAHGTYYELGKALGTFGYTVQKKKKNKKKPQAKAAPAKK